MPGIFETIRRKDAEWEAERNRERETGTGAWEEDYWESERQRSLASRVLLGSGLPPHPLYGKNAEEKVCSFLRWFL